MQHHDAVVQPTKLQHQGVVTELDVLEIDNPFCSAVIALQGAQVLHYQQKSKHSGQVAAPLLWVSAHNSFASGVAIRGGIPLCFPWFSKHPNYADLPSHGFARNLIWALESVTENADGHHVVLSLEHNPTTYAMWPYVFKAQLEVQFGEKLSLKCSVNNTGEQSFDFKFLFHSYFAVDDIHQTEVTGLENTPFLDQLKPQQGSQNSQQQPIRFDAETDRIYRQAQGDFRIVQPKHADIVISSDCTDAVVWNPWIEKTGRLHDMAAEAWQHMLCVECGQVAEPVTLSAGETRTFKLLLL